jgi:PAT family beta-lactamase induction signal transducer AmpG
LLLIVGVAVAVAFASATQDIVVDAWRIEAAQNEGELGLFSSAYQFGYRVALLVTDALILISAEHLGWPLSYGMMAALMGIGIFGAMSAPEPERRGEAAETKPFFTLSGFAAAVIDPFIVFFKRHGVIALLMLAMISLYRLPDFMMGPMAGPFYKDLGLTKDLVGSIRMFVGLPSALLGIAAGGLLIERFGQMKALMLGAVLQALAVASFSLLALIGTGLPLFCAVMAADSFCISIAGVALVTYLSTLTSFGYTATQYALLSSAYAYVGKTLKGFSGRIVDDLAQDHGRLEAYAIFFLGAGAIGIPALILCGVLGRVRPTPAPVPMN